MFRTEHPVLLMVLLFVLLLVHPFFQRTPVGGMVLSVLFMLVILAAGMSVWRRRRLLIVVWLLGLPATILALSGNLFDLPMALDVLAIALMFSCTGIVAVLLLKNIMTTTVVSQGTLARAVSVYLLFGVTWAGLYSMMRMLDPTSFRIPADMAEDWGGYLYFSFTTLTTLGFGDITPLSPQARSVVMIESIVGPIYLAIIVARLVSFYERSRPRDPKRDAKRDA